MFVLNPFHAQTGEDVQFMDHFRQLSPPMQRVIIGLLLLVVIAAIVILRDMIMTEEKTKQTEEMSS
ncbi:MAG: hypothetical protein PVH03_08030 [Chloroflexota bacterium]|jgi:cell division protein ZapA (FtsZ GTPase activity inhibitor)